MFFLQRRSLAADNSEYCRAWRLKLKLLVLAWKKFASAEAAYAGMMTKRCSKAR